MKDVVGKLPLILSLAGAIALFVAVTFDTAPEGTHNIGLMQTQMMWFGFGATSWIIAAILFVGQRLGDLLMRRPAGPSE